MPALPRRQSAMLALLLIALPAAAPRAAAAPPAPVAGRQTVAESPDPWSLCLPAVQAAEAAHALPPGLLAAIAAVETGRRHPATGQILPWPWAINAEGRGQFLASRAEAVAAVRALQARGVRSIDVGCLQVNLHHHPDAFASLEAAFDPAVNAAYAARYLRGLAEAAGSWTEAAGHYHSLTPERGDAYRTRVAAAWVRGREQGVRAAGGAAPPPGAIGAGAPATGWRPAPVPGLRRFVATEPAAAAPTAPVLPAAAPAAARDSGRDLDSYRARPVARSGAALALMARLAAAPRAEPRGSPSFPR